MAVDNLSLILTYILNCSVQLMKYANMCDSDQMCQLEVMCVALFSGIIIMLSVKNLFINNQFRILFLEDKSTPCCRL